METRGRAKLLSLDRGDNRAVPCLSPSRHFLFRTNSNERRRGPTGDVERRRTDIYRCKSCNRLFTNYRDMIQHIWATYPDEPQKKLIGKSSRHLTARSKMCFQTKVDIKKPKAVQKFTSKKPVKIVKGSLVLYDCPLCNCKFNTKPKLINHVNFHLQEIGRTPCTELEETKKKQRNTLRKKKNLPNGKHKCILCDRTFVSAAKLTKHMSFHKRWAPMKCLCCNKPNNIRQKKNIACPSALDTLGQIANLCGDCQKALEFLQKHMKANREKEETDLEVIHEKTSVSSTPSECHSSKEESEQILNSTKSSEMRLAKGNQHDLDNPNAGYLRRSEEWISSDSSNDDNSPGVDSDLPNKEDSLAVNSIQYSFVECQYCGKIFKEKRCVTLHQETKTLVEEVPLNQ